MTVIAFDTETDRFRPGCQLPPIACLQYAEINQGGGIGKAAVLGMRDGLYQLHEWLRDPSVILIGAEVAYDMLCPVTTCDVYRSYAPCSGEELLGLIVQAYETNRVTDVFIREKLRDLARGCYRYERDVTGKVVGQNGYSLQALTRKYVKHQLSKNKKDDEDHVRLRYGELRWVPADQWPREAYDYALDDGIATALVAVAQCKPSSHVMTNFPGVDPVAAAFVDEFNQVRGALWLKAMAAYGLRTDLSAIRKFETYVKTQYEKTAEELVSWGLVRREFKRDAEAITAYAKAQGVWELVRGTEADTGNERLSYARAGLQSAARTAPLFGLLAAQEHAHPALIEAGLIKVKETRDTKAAQARMIEIMGGLDKCQLTDGGAPKLDKETCANVDDVRLHSYAELSHLGKMLSTDIKILRTGVTLPIHTHFEPLLETGRTSSAKPNVQNQARGGKEKCPAGCITWANEDGTIVNVVRGSDGLVTKCAKCEGTGRVDMPGARECYVPRPGWVLIDSDYAMLELHTLAQTCYWLLGWSSLGDALKTNLDPHTMVACQILGGIPYEEGKRLKKIKDKRFDDARNAGKAVNFGRPGGLGAETLKSYASKSYNVDKTKEEWQAIITTWNATWGEMPEYFRMVNKLESYPKSGMFNLKQVWSNRLRAGATYCSACNSFYQGLGADVAKLAGWNIFKACYVDRSSPLYGARPVNFIHDQFLVEVKEDGREFAAAEELGRLMNAAGALILPDVPVKCEPILARRWSKLANGITNDSGELVGVWEDMRLAS